MGSPAQDQIVGRTLNGVRYYLPPNCAWQRTPDLHQLDYGLDLEFADGVIGVTWALGTMALSMAPRSLRDELLDPDEVDVRAVDPWSRAIGTAVSALIQGPRAQAGAADESCVWSVEIRFGPDVKVWLAAATIVESQILLPCWDELIVISDPKVARRFGLR